MEESEIPADVQEKILRFAQMCSRSRTDEEPGLCGTSVQFPWESWVSFIDPPFYIKYLGMRPEWVDMTEILRRMDLGIYDEEEFKEALAWVRAALQGRATIRIRTVRAHSGQQKDEEWEFVVKMTHHCAGYYAEGNERLADKWASYEEALGRNAIVCRLPGTADVDGLSAEWQTLPKRF